MKSKFRIMGSLLLLLLSLLVVSSPKKMQRGNGGADFSLVELQLASDAGALLRRPVPETIKEQVRAGLHSDNRMVIPAYTAMFALLAFLLGWLGRPIACQFTLAGGFGAAICDYGENRWMGRVLLDAQWQAYERMWAGAKWGFFFGTTTLIAIHFIRQAQFQLIVIGAIYLLAGLSGWCLTAVALVDRIYLRTFNLAVLLIFIGTFLLALFLLFKPRSFDSSAEAS